MKGKAKESAKRNHVQVCSHVSSLSQVDTYLPHYCVCIWSIGVRVEEGQARVRRARSRTDVVTPQRHHLDDEVQSRWRTVSFRGSRRDSASLESEAELERRRQDSARDRREADSRGGTGAVVPGLFRARRACILDSLLILVVRNARVTQCRSSMSHGAAATSSCQLPWTR